MVLHRPFEPAAFTGHWALKFIPSILSDAPFLPSDFVAGYEESRIIWLTTRNTMNILELTVDAFVVLLGASLFIWAKPLASALNYWAAQQYVRFPKLKMLPGARNAG